MQIAPLITQKIKQRIKQNVNLKPYNSFGFNVFAKFFIQTQNIDEIKQALDFAKQQKLPYLIIGSGSNLVFTQDFAGLVIKLSNNKTSLIANDQIYADAGVCWHDLVKFTLEHNLYGLENLAQVPGTCGAAPVQNIGAYGAEFADVCVKVKVLNIANHQIYDLTAKECCFSYRNSIFKQNLGKWLILGIYLQLNNEFKPNLSYSPLAAQFTNKANITAFDVFNAVCKIRSSKLPNPCELGNAGSFFKNPLICFDDAQNILKQYPNAPLYPQHNNTYKIAAGWLIEQCALKGLRIKGAGVHKHQALVLVNHGNATGFDILNLAKLIQDKVFTKFKINLEIEPIII